MSSLSRIWLHLVVSRNLLSNTIYNVSQPFWKRVLFSASYLAYPPLFMWLVGRLAPGSLHG